MNKGLSAEELAKYTEVTTGRSIAYNPLAKVSTLS